MKFRRKILISVITVLLATGLLIINNSYASAGPLYLNIKEIRDSGYGYKALEKIIWKITSYDQAGNENKNNNKKTIYCIKGGPGFGSSDMSTVASPNNGTFEYTRSFDMNKYDQIPNDFKQVLPTGDNYKALVWILKNCYIQPSETASDEEKNIAESYRTELLNKAFDYYMETTDMDLQGGFNKEYGKSHISDDEIDIAQQLAIWTYTNDDNVWNALKKNNGYTFSLSKRSANSATYVAVGNQDIRYIQALYKYLVVKAKENISTALDTTDVEKNPISLSSEKATISQNDTNYILGPYKITNTEENNLDYNLEGILTSANGNNEISYSLLNSNKENVNSLKALIGNDFYISVPKTATENIKDIKLKIISSRYITKVTYWSVANPSLYDQPVAEVERERKTYEITASTSEFDLALRKFITKINGNNVAESREPDVTADTLAKLKSGEVTTTTKTHTKTPLTVEVGDTVLYTIRIYNEGNVNGYAKEITDYLPNGLSLKANSTINKENGWKNPSGDEKTIVTDKLATTLLNKFDGTTLAYADVEVECEVTASYSGKDISLKNVAEITKHSNEVGDETVVDRDSIPSNLTDAQKSNYNPGTSEQGWGYEDDDDYEDLLLPAQRFDLALRKFITKINKEELVNSDGTYIREPKIDVSPLVNKTATTANYSHRKDPIGVSVGDEVIYTLRIYNEGKVDGYASEVTDYLPPQLEFINDDFNTGYGWLIDSTGRKATTTHLSKEYDEDNLIKAFDANTMTTPDYKELKIKCKVKSVENLNEVITNIAEITAFTDSEGNTITDIDSGAKNVSLPSDTNLPDYKGNGSNKSILSDSNYFYKGQQDDDDFEKLILEEFDLALRKFITKINDVPPTISREPKFTRVIDENGNYIYEHTKEPLEVESTDVVEYTLRIFNEGDISGYAKVIKDDIPSGLEFLPENELNKEYRWKMLDEEGKETDDVTKASYITTDYLSKEQEKTSGANLIKAFDQSSMESPAYKDVKVAFKVVAPNTHEGIITNTAEIADDSDEEGNPVIDRDSTPNNNNKKEDDIDVEHIRLKYFDLALRKFITGVNDKEITNRIPVFTIDENGKYVYNHTKEPVEVVNGDTVIYTLRIYNEGTKAGYAEEVKDDLPEGLEFLPENEVNITNRWKMLDEEGKETEDITKAVSIKTDILSRAQNAEENLLKAFDKDSMKEPDHRDIKIAFKVTEPNTSDRIIINKAQISDDADENGKPVIDIDSTPDKWIEGEDDQDIEKIKVKYFDLALRKWVTQAIVIENGKEKVTETGHKAEDDPEEVVKVELVESKINKVVVKFRYKIRITNEGEIAGYATEISDYIPEGLKFVAADNPKWKEVDGKIVTDQLKDTLLQPGDTAEVEVLLTWINSKNNLGLKVNTAEISKDKNDSNTPDIDSTPNNKKPGEDDIDDAPVILSVKTGAGIKIEYIITTGAALVILAGSAILIKKYVLI